MSLKTILDSPATTAFFKGRIRVPKVDPPLLVRVSPGEGLPQLVGSGFDYALRFGLQARFFCVALGQTAAEVGAGLGVSFGHSPDDVSNAVLEARDAIEVAREGAAGTELTSDVAAACLRLAAFESIYRSGRPDGFTRHPAATEVAELRALFEIVPWEEFAPEERIHLNPTFGEGSEAVGGAGADLVLDDTMIEVKTVARSRLSPKIIRQLLCYAVLARRFGLDGDDSSTEITELGVYFARAGSLVRASLAECLLSAEEEVVQFLLEERH